MLSDIPKMEHVTVVDLSYNHLTELSSIVTTFPNLTSLDLSFNRLSSLNSLQVHTIYIIGNMHLLSAKQNCIFRVCRYAKIEFCNSYFFDCFKNECISDDKLRWL